MIYSSLILASIIHFFLFSSFANKDNNFKEDDPEMKPYSMDWRTGNDTDFDLSFLLEKPAGKNGFITIKDGHFYSPKGSRFRIWGVNMSSGACFPEKEDAPLVAAFLARNGINGVRFHFFDTGRGEEYSIFDLSKDNTRTLNPEQLDKFDFLINELKKQGIYSNINLNVARHFKSGDDVAESEYLGFAKAVTLFDDRLIFLQKEYARQLLTHRNPYTGNQYINEPAVMIVEIVNENSLVEAWFGGRLEGSEYIENPQTWDVIPPYYQNELTEKYNDWLSRNRSSEQIEKLAKEAGVNPNDMIPRLDTIEFSDASPLRFESEASFLIDTEAKYFSQMYHYLKVTLGVKAHIVGNSDHDHSRGAYAMLSSLSKTDVIDGHVYWQHPDYIIDRVSDSYRITFEYTPMVNEPSMSTVVQLSRSAIKGKPYTVSETNHPFPSEFASEGIPILAAYGLLQDWDGIYYYSLSGDDPKMWNEKGVSPFSIYADPVKMTNMAAGALMFLRKDIASTDSVIYRDYSREEIFEGIRGDIGVKPFFTNGFNPVTSLIYKTRIDGFFREHGSYQPFKTGNPIVSHTGELSWYHDNGRGLVTIETDRTEGLIGFLKDNQKTLHHLNTDIKNSFCTILLISMDEKSIAESEQILLATTATSGLTGMVYNESRTELIEWGKMPTVIEPVTGTIRIENLRDIKSAELISIDGNGMKIKSEPISIIDPGKLSFQIGKVTTPLYVINITR